MGARQVGKSTLIEEIQNELNAPIMWWSGDKADIRELLLRPTSTGLKNLLGNTKTLIIDEAQRIENIGVIIKLIVDQIKNIKVIATGSSAFELANKINEPLTGRKWEFQLFPLSYGEMVAHHGLLEERRSLEHRLIFGYYPDIIQSPGEEIIRLKQLVDSYLYKDVLNWDRILKAEKLEKLVQALAFQVGSEVSYNELGRITGLDNETVEKYIQLLEQAFVVFRLKAFNRNLRNELKKSRKIYFYDNGVRNAVINQFNPINLRDDKGALWENFVIVERMKYLGNTQNHYLKYFWRTHAQQEIDYVEEKDAELFAYEFKWNPKAKAKFPKSFVETYSPKETKVISPENFESFIGLF